MKRTGLAIRSASLGIRRTLKAFKNSDLFSIRRILILFLPALVLMLVSVISLGLVLKRSTAFLLQIAVIGLIISRLIFLFISERSAGRKIAIAVIWLVILGFSAFNSVFLPMAMHHCSKEDAQNRFEASVSRMPNGAIFGSLDTRSSLSSEYHTYTYSALWFRGISFTLLSSYSEAEYEKAISLIEEHFWFRTDPVGTGPLYASSEKLIEPHVRISDCCFRIVYPGNGSEDPFYEECMLIMNNDAKHEIAYIAFSDYDLDAAYDLEEFINDYCGWESVYG